MKRNNLDKSIYSKLASILSSLLVFVICLFVSVKVIMANIAGVPPAIFGFSVSEVPTNSMEPTINTGDYIIFHSISYEDVELNDIIVYKSKDSNIFIIHRVIEIHDDYLICQGDNNVLPDEEHITSDMVIGEYMTSINFLSILGSSDSRQGLFMILMLILFLILILQVVMFILRAKKEKNAKAANDIKEEVLLEMRKQILEEELNKMKNKNDTN